MSGSTACSTIVLKLASVHKTIPSIGPQLSNPEMRMIVLNDLGSSLATFKLCSGVVSSLVGEAVGSNDGSSPVGNGGKMILYHTALM